MTNEERIERINKRYRRQVIANPRGAIVHYGDCWIYVCGICNCGLHADLIILSDNKQEELYPKFWEEWAMAHARRDQLREIPPPVIKELTDEEKKQYDEELSKIFGAGRNKPCG